MVLSLPTALRLALPALLLAAATAGAQGRELHERIARPERGDTPYGGAKYLAFLREAGSALESLERPGEPTLAFAVLEPRDYRLDYRYRRRADELGMSFEFRPGAARLPAPVRGTVLMLHGLTMDASTQGLWGLALAEEGYRTVLLDLRNHGLSGDGPAGYGTREADDVQALLARLQADRRLAQPLYLFGTSYGAVTAINVAARPGSGVTGVVAMEPYANAADSVRQYVRSLKAGGSGGWRDRLLAWWLRRALDESELEAAIGRAGQLLGLDLDRLDTGPALAASQACVLLLQGARDHLVPVATARALARTAAPLAYVELPDENHYSLPARIDWLRLPIRDWLQAAAHADRASCPGLQLPPDPLR